MSASISSVVRYCMTAIIPSSGNIGKAPLSHIPSALLITAPLPGKITVVAQACAHLYTQLFLLLNLQLHM